MKNVLRSTGNGVRGIIPIYAVILLIVAVGAAGIFIYTSQRAAKQLEPATNTVVNTSTVVTANTDIGNANAANENESTNNANENANSTNGANDASVNSNVSVDATKDWETYTNTKWGFSFKYPKDWKVIQDSLQVIGDVAPTTKNVVKVGINPRPQMEFYVDPTGFGDINTDYLITIEKKNKKFEVTREEATGAKEGEFGLNEYYYVRAREVEGANSPRFWMNFKSDIEGRTSAEFNALVKDILSTFTFTK